MKIAQIDWGALEGVATPNFEAGTSTPADIINTLIPYFFTIAGFALLIYLVIGGYQWLTSLGNPKGIEGAKGTITFALLGFFIIFFAYWIYRTIFTILGLRVLMGEP